MARLARVVAVNIPHYGTQRGNASHFVLELDSDKLVYLDLLRQYCSLYELSLMGYCLMSNHVHQVAIPRNADSLPLTLKHTHGRYAAYWNASHRSSRPCMAATLLLLSAPSEPCGNRDSSTRSVHLQLP
jgi:putative transposase